MDADADAEWFEMLVDLVRAGVDIAVVLDLVLDACAHDPMLARSFGLAQNRRPTSGP